MVDPDSGAGGSGGASHAAVGNHAGIENQLRKIQGGKSEKKMRRNPIWSVSQAEKTKKTKNGEREENRQKNKREEGEERRRKKRRERERWRRRESESG